MRVDIDDRDGGFYAGVKAVLFIRCMKHRDVAQLNSQENSGGECGACVREGAVEGYVKISNVIQTDVGELLLALGRSAHARPESPHEVVQGEIIPAIRKLVREAESWQLRFHCPRHGNKDWDAPCRCDLKDRWERDQEVGNGEAVQGSIQPRDDAPIVEAAKQLIAVIYSEPDGPILKADGQPPWAEVSELIRALVESRAMEHPDDPTGGA